MTTGRMLLISLLALASSTAHAALPSDCTQSDYPRRVIPACTEILAKDPNNAVAYFKRGKANVEIRTDTQLLDQAIADLTKAIEINPGYAEAYAERGMAYQRKADYPRAIADTTKTIELDPSLSLAYRVRGTVYLQQRDYARALADDSKAIELNPTSTTGYVARAFTYAAKGDTDLAIDDIEKAFKLGLGYRLEELTQDDLDRIRPLLTKAIERNGQDALAYYARGRLEAMDEKWERAVADYSNAIERDPTLVAAYIYRGRAYQELSYDDPRALADLNKAIELDPKNPHAYVARGLFHVEQIRPSPERQYADALADYTKAIEVDPTFAWAYMYRSHLHALGNEWAQAKADVAKAIDLEWRLWAMMQIYPHLLDEVEAERQAAPR
jgi:tetratricopeptide (TPR) repeat protein